MHNRALARAVLAILLIETSFVQTTIANASTPDNQPPKPAAETAAAPAKPAMQGFGLEDATPVKMRTSRTISSGDAHVGDMLDFEVLEEVTVDGVVVIPKSSIAWGTVTEAEPKRRMARGGKLNVNIDSVRLADGEKIPLRAVQGGKGGGHTGAMTGAMVATGIVFFPAAPLFLFMHGKDITIPKGTEVTAYINGDTKLERAKFQAGAAGNASASVASGNATQTSSTPEVMISSTPPGADIEIDGKFVGSTPSSVGVAPGDHEITVKKNGFAAWDRKISVSAGKININADLTPEAK
jgi:hypothetical protein